MRHLFYIFGDSIFKYADTDGPFESPGTLREQPQNLLKKSEAITVPICRPKGYEQERTRLPGVSQGQNFASAAFPGESSCNASISSEEEMPHFGQLSAKRDPEPCSAFQETEVKTVQHYKVGTEKDNQCCTGMDILAVTH